MNPVVSVCVANYNGIGLIEACIESVLNQTAFVPVEILVHDDCSADGSAEMLASRYRQVELMRSDENVGFCVSNNRMGDRATGEYLLLLNNDAMLLPDAIETLYRAAQALGQAAILSLPQYDAQTGALIDNGCLLDPFANPVPNRDLSRQDVGMVMGACLWIPRRLWHELGGFPEWFGSIGEDLHLCCRARLAGYPVRALGVSGYRHRVGQSFGGGGLRRGLMHTTFRRRALSEQNKSFVMVMDFPAPLPQLLLPLHLFLLLLEGCALALVQGRLSVLMRIYLPVFSGLFRRRRELRRGRTAAMAARRISAYRFLEVFDPVPYKLRMFVRHGLPRID